MSSKELRELDAWIGTNVMDYRPINIRYASADGGKSMTLWESDEVTRQDVPLLRG